MTARVCVIGGGLAGIAAALRAADAGHTVTMLETRPDLGGATYSFRRGELTVDTGQHVFLRCYEQYRALLHRLGSDRFTHVQDRFTIQVLQPGAPPHRLWRTRGLPAPAHLGPALLRYRALSVRERLLIMYAALALRRVDPADPANDAISFGAWLARHRQSPRAIARLWGLITVAALNTTPDDASLALAARVFRTGLLERAAAGDIGRPLVPLSQLHGEPARVELQRCGVNVVTRTRAIQITPTEPGFTIGHTGGELTADGVILAVPHAAAAELVPPKAAPDATEWNRLGDAAIVNVHLVYEEPVTDVIFAATIDSPAQWIFDRSGLYPGDGQYLVISLSAADQQNAQPAAELIAEQRTALAELFPRAGQTAIRDAFVTREPRATFRQVSGSRALRPSMATRLPGLVLAGAWVDTGWPDTMEGAVRSGNAAADTLLGHLASAPHRYNDTREALP